MAKLRVDSRIEISADELSSKQWKALLAMLTFVDNNEVEITSYNWLETKNVLQVPRGVLDALPPLDVTDLRSRPKAAKYQYVKQLDAKGHEGQLAALGAMVKNEQGQVIAPPGKGKTEIGLAFAANCKTTTLVVVHTKDLFEQWYSRAQESVPGIPLGKISGGKCQTGILTIAMAQTLRRYVPSGGKFWRQFGCVLIDEAQHAGAETWEWLLNVCPAYYRFGLTATRKRADGRTPLIRYLIGPVIYEIKFESQVPLEVQPIRTGFRGMYRGPFDWSRMLRVLCANEQRNQYIADNVRKDIEGGHTVLVLSRQIKHLEHIRDTLNMNGQVALLTGRMPMRKRNQILEDFKDGNLSCILATQLADEGLDVPRLDRVHLTFPGKHDGRIIQQIGRAIRTYPDKQDALIYDYVDDFIPPLARQYVARKRTYKTLDIPTRKVVGYGSYSKKGRNLLDHFRVKRSRSS
jgi:superfamily II DNA or RNA helicase